MLGFQGPAAYSPTQGYPLNQLRGQIIFIIVYVNGEVAYSLLSYTKILHLPLWAHVLLYEHP